MGALSAGVITQLNAHGVITLQQNMIRQSQEAMLPAMLTEFGPTKDLRLQSKKDVP